MTQASDLPKSYEDRFPILEDVAESLEAHLQSFLSGIPRIDAISARAKSPDRFIAKALKTNDDGSFKYKNPDFEIQDQIGGRITVFYLEDIERIRKEVVKYLKYIEVQDKSPIKDAEFGYFGVHFIMKIPDDIIPDIAEDGDVPEFFELQIKTLFQHAWSEAHHDLGYKSIRALTSDEQRLVAFTAAQAWGADTIFQQLAKVLCVNDNEQSEGASAGT